MKHITTNRPVVRKMIAAALCASLTLSLAATAASARTIVLSGDYDLDGTLTSTDALSVLRASIGDGDIANTQWLRADVDGDGDVTSNDAIEILRDSVGLIRIAQSRSASDPYTVNDGLNDFSAQVFKKTYEQGENTLVSPLSIYTALAMLQNGANGKTQQEMLDMLGGGSNSADDINSYMNKYISTINNGSFLNTANAMYVMQRGDITIGQPFVTEIQKDYFAEVFYEPANDDTVDKINDWVKTNTKDMIDSILDKGSLDPTHVALLLNAVSFKADWAEQYEDWQIQKDFFTNYDGSKVETDFLYGEEYAYISDDLSEGFIKPYRTGVWDDEGNYKRDESYAFIAILPKKGVSVDEYIAQMNDSTIRELVASKKYMSLRTKLPKFKYDCTFNMNDILKSLGMESAFSRDDADFTPLAVSSLDENVYVNSVIHKTFIDLDESGTRAAAVTAIDMEADSAPEPPAKNIELTRPFIYVIYDMNNDVPAFIGTVCTLNGTPVTEPIDEVPDKDVDTDHPLGEPEIICAYPIGD